MPVLNPENSVECEKDVQAIDLDSVMKKCGHVIGDKYFFIQLVMRHTDESIVCADFREVHEERISHNPKSTDVLRVYKPAKNKKPNVTSDN